MFPLEWVSSEKAGVDFYGSHLALPTNLPLPFQVQPQHMKGFAWVPPSGFQVTCTALLEPPAIRVWATSQPHLKHTSATVDSRRSHMSATSEPCVSNTWTVCPPLLPHDSLTKEVKKFPYLFNLWLLSDFSLKTHTYVGLRMKENFCFMWQHQSRAVLWE